MRYRQLQILRALAASFVVVDHSLLAAWPDNERYIYIGWCFGDLGVGIFFVISGFIMAHIVRVAPTGVYTSLRFAGTRLKRIVPLYWIATFIVVAKSPFAPNLNEAALSTETVLKSMFFVPYGNYAGLFRPVHAPGWTLNYEMFFYLLFAISLWQKNAKNAVYLCCVLLSILLLVGMVLQNTNWGGNPKNIFEFYSYPIIILFVAGMAFRSLLPRAKIGFSVQNAAVLNSLMPICCVLIFAVFIKTYPVSMMWRFCVWGVCAATVFGTLLLETQASPRYGTGVLEFLGDASYSTYLFQPFAFAAVKALRHHFASPNFVTFCGCVAGAQMLGAVVHLTLEKPIISLFAPNSRTAQAV